MSVGRDLSLLAGRAVLGGYLAGHGAQKLFGAFDGPGLAPIAGAFDRLGLRPGRVMATVAAVSEFGGGLLTAAGLADPLGPVVIAGTMAVASATHRANGPFSAKGGYELALTNLGAALALAATGPGRYSIDGLTGSRLPRRLSRLVTAGAVVTSAASLVMVVRTRPPAPSPAADTASADDETPEAAQS